MEAFGSVFGLDHAMLTILASDVFRVGAEGFGFLQSARGLGAVIGSSIFIGMGQRPDQGKILFVSAILYGAGFALFGLSPSFPIALALLTFVGATDTVWGASRGTILQMLTPEKFRGRVMGVFQLSNRGLHPLGQTETGLDRAADRRARSDFRRRHDHIDHDAVNRLARAGDRKIPLGPHRRQHDGQQGCGGGTNRGLSQAPARLSILPSRGFSAVNKITATACWHRLTA